MIRAVALFALMPAVAPAITLDLPEQAVSTQRIERALDTTPIATGAFRDGAVPILRPRGEVTLESWRIPVEGLSSLQILDPLSEQLSEAGFETLYECADRRCGGFDFRFALEVLPAPDMHVSLGDYRYLSASRGEEEHVAILVSRTSRAGYVQIVRVGPEDAGVDLAVSTRSTGFEPASLGDLGQALETDGRYVLGDLDFDTGSAQLGPGSFRSLSALADYLGAVPSRRVALVGHTDSSGSLDTNIALSRRRAASVLDRLVTEYGVNRTQVEAQGMGYLSPISTNLNAAGREANRRVEVILTSTE